MKFISIATMTFSLVAATWRPGFAQSSGADGAEIDRTILPVPTARIEGFKNSATNLLEE